MPSVWVDLFAINNELTGDELAWEHLIWRVTLRLWGRNERRISHPVDDSHDVVGSPSAIHLVSPRTKGNLAHLLGQSELFTGGARRQRCCCCFGSRPSAALAALEIENTNCKSGYGDHSQRPRVPFIAGDCHVC